jgi:hypothetical protein
LAQPDLLLGPKQDALAEAASLYRNNVRFQVRISKSSKLIRIIDMNAA